MLHIHVSSQLYITEGGKINFFIVPDDSSSTFSGLVSTREELPSTTTSALLGLSQLPPWFGLETFCTSPMVARVAPVEKSEPMGSCEVRQNGFFTGFLIKELDLVFSSDFNSFSERSKSILSLSNLFFANS